MRSFIELAVAGNRRAVVDTSTIVAVDMPFTKEVMATTESPIRLLLRDAEPLMIVAIEPAMLLGKLLMIAAKVESLRADNAAVPSVLVLWLDDADEAPDG